MTAEQMQVFALIAVTMGLFLWGRWRHDIVALFALLVAVVIGLVPQDAAFTGFAQPAVITVACVLVLSRGLQRTGAIDVLARRVIPADAGRLVSLALLCGLGAALSAFMNNVGALALLMPLAVRIAHDAGVAPGRLLMPLSFATILGGMTTLIGTPPNLIVSTFHAEAGLGRYSMFDFAPVGLPVALAGVAFLVLVGWRLVPARDGGADGEFKTGAYFTELRVTEASVLIDHTLAEAEDQMQDAGGQIVAMVRNGVYLSAPRGSRVVREGDILVVEAEIDRLGDLLGRLGLALQEDVRPETEDEDDPAPEGEDEAAHKARAEAARARAEAREAARTAPRYDAATITRRAMYPQPLALPAPAPAATTATTAGADDAGAAGDDADAPRSAGANEILLREYVVRPGSDIEGRTPMSMSMRTRWGINLLAVSRSGAQATSRLRAIAFAPGDLLLLQGPPDALAEFAAETGVVPLAERTLGLPDKRLALFAALIMLAAIGVAAVGLLPTAITFAIGVVASVLLRTVPLRELYSSIDWSVIVLLAALIPVAGAMESTGAAALLAGWLVNGLAGDSALIGLTLVMVITMTLSDVMNNAATAAVMCPIALNIATLMGLPPDGFLMAVAIGASCAFLTPIGHQNNTLILGPGGFRFGDYWRAGILVELLVIAVSVPLLMTVWM